MRRYVELAVVALVSVLLVHATPVTRAGQDVFGMDATILNWDGMIAFFPGECPNLNWEEFVPLRGRYVVGVPENGTLLGATGGVMTNLEVRRGGTAQSAPTFHPSSLTYTFPRLSLNYNSPSLDYTAPSLAYSASSARYTEPTLSYTASSANYTAPSLNFRAGSVDYRRPTVNYTRPTMSYRNPTVSYTRPTVTYTRPTVNYTRPTVRHQHVHAFTDQSPRSTRSLNLQTGGTSRTFLGTNISSTTKDTAGIKRTGNNPPGPVVSGGGVSLSGGGASISGGGVSLSGGGASISGGGVSLSGGSATYTAPTASISGGTLTFTRGSATFHSGSFTFTRGTADFSPGSATLNAGSLSGSLVGGSITLNPGSITGGGSSNQPQPAPYIQLRACRYLP